MAKPPRLFAVAPAGLEAITDAELKRHGFRSREVVPGGVHFRGSPLKANRVLATADRILMPVGRFEAPNFDALIAGAEAVDWSRFGGLTPKVTSQRSRLFHTDAIAERLSGVVPPGDGTLLCRLNRNRCTLDVDTTGEDLHRRGWRQPGGPTPLRETFAARLLALAGWTPGMALADPFCGSGTVLIEAAVQAEGLAPGRLRTFACEAWWRTELTPRGEPVPTSILGTDAALAAVKAAKRNAEHAGVTITFARRAADEATPPAESGLLICSPPDPHGSESKLAAWDQLDAALSGAFARWSAAILSPDPKLAARLSRPVRARHTLHRGGRTVDLLLLDPS